MRTRGAAGIHLIRVLVDKKEYHPPTPGEEEREEQFADADSPHERHTVATAFCLFLNPSSVLLSASLSYCSFPSSPSAQSIVFSHIAAHIYCSFTMPQTLFQEIYMHSFNSHNHPRKWIPLPPFKVV